jgi:guanylate kinase
MNKKPILNFVGPAGSGKTSLAKMMCDMDSDYMRSVSHTSRGIRGNEKDGIDYHYITKTKFLLMIEQGDFLEHNPNYATHHYGTSKREFGRIQKLQKIPVLDIDYRGAEQVFNHFNGTGVPLYSGFIWSPEDVLRKRMLERGGLSAQQIDTRLQRFFEEEYPFAQENVGPGKIFQKIYYNTELTVLSVLANEFYNDAMTSIR